MSQALLRGWLAILGTPLALLCTVVGGVSSHPAQAQTAAAPFTTAYRWDSMRRLVGTISPAASGTTAPFLATRYTYDGDGRLVLTEKGYLSTWQPTTVFPVNWPVASASGFTVVTQIAVQFDAAGNKIAEITASAGGTAYKAAQYSYDADDRPLCNAVRMNTASFPAVGSAGAPSGGSLPASACLQPSSGPDLISQNVYDAAGELIQLVKATGVTTANGYPQTLQQAYATYGYSLNGKTTDVIDANGNHAQYQYDGFDRQIAWIFPSIIAPTAFNPATQGTALATAGAVASCNIGPVAQTTVNWPDGTSVAVVGPANAMNTGDNCEKYSYDADANRIILVKRDGTVLSYEQDALNRVVEKFVPQRTGLPATDARSVTYSYDLLGHQLTASFADQNNGVTEGMTFVYDNVGRKTSSTIVMDAVSRKLSYAYDADNNRTQVTHPDGTYFSSAYDGLDRLQNATWWSAAAGQVPFMAISYDAFGRRTNTNRASSFTLYGYDPVSRLNSLAQQMNGVDSPQPSNATVTQTFSFSPADQIVQRTTSNNAFVYTGNVNVTRPYTVNGLNQYGSAGSANFTYDANGNLTGDGLNTYLYDVENRLVAASGAHTAAIRYDPLGRIYEVAGANGTTRFLYDGDAMVGEYATNGTQLHRYMWGANPDELVLWDQGAALNCSGTSVAQPDNQGSLIAWANCSGIQTATNTYDEYGIPGSANVGRFQYTGQAWIPELGMYYYKARMYSPTIGRFMQVDRIGYKDQVNLYAYVANDPVDKTDYSGNETGTFANGCQGDGRGCDPSGNAHRVATRIALTLAGALLPEVEIPEIVVTASVGRQAGLLTKIGQFFGRLFSGGSKAEEAADTAAVGLRRPYIRQSVRREVETAAPRTPDGRPIDPNTGQPINGKPDLGHTPGNEFWREKQAAEGEGLTQKQFNDRMNDPNKYQLEDPSSNRSRKYEQP